MPEQMPDRYDPYHDRKVYHMALLVSPRGDISPLCADKPRKLRLSRERWTIVAKDVTCPKCLERMKGKPLEKVLDAAVARIMAPLQPLQPIHLRRTVIQP